MPDALLAANTLFAYVEPHTCTVSSPNDGEHQTKNPHVAATAQIPSRRSRVIERVTAQLRGR
jgi:hypothetical protein